MTTGAIVLRQPFGGFGKSVFGPGMKAGGPNYVAQFMDLTDTSDTDDANAHVPPDRPTLAALCAGLRSRAPSTGFLAPADGQRIVAAVLSCERHQREEFGRQHDHFKLAGQDNIRRYHPLRCVRVRVHPEDTAFDLFVRVCAAHTAGCRVAVSVPPGFSAPALTMLEELTENGAGAIEFIEESDYQLAHALRDRQTDRLRYAASDRVPLAVLAAAAETGICVVSTPVLREGRVEMLWYLQEQSLSVDYHRYGNLGRRAREPRAPVD